MPMDVVVSGETRKERCNRPCPNGAVGLWSPEWDVDLSTDAHQLEPLCAACSIDLVKREHGDAQALHKSVNENLIASAKREPFLGSWVFDPHANIHQARSVVLRQKLVKLNRSRRSSVPTGHAKTWRNTSGRTPNRPDGAAG